MKEALGGMGIIIIAVFFITFFGAFLSVSVNYSKAFKVKNEILNIIERDEGLSDDTLNDIYAYITEVGYRSVGSCDDGSWLGYNINSNGETYKNPMFCVEKVVTNSGDSVEVPASAYYKVRVFYQMDLPIVQVFTHFRIEGTTKQITFPKD